MRSVLRPSDTQPARALLAARARTRGESLTRSGASASVTVTDIAAQSETSLIQPGALELGGHKDGQSERGQAGSMCGAAASCCLLWRPHHTMQQSQRHGKRADRLRACSARMWMSDVQMTRHSRWTGITIQETEMLRISMRRYGGCGHEPRAPCMETRDGFRKPSEAR